MKKTNGDIVLFGIVLSTFTALFGYYLTQESKVCCFGTCAIDPIFFTLGWCGVVVGLTTLLLLLYFSLRRWYKWESKGRR